MGFRVGPALNGATFRKYDLRGKRLSKRFKKFRDYITSTDHLDLPVHRYLDEWVRKVEWMPGYEVVLEEIAQTKDVALYQVDLINNCLIRTKVCEFGRFHSNYTGLVKELRKYLRILGEKLYEIDVVSSQPYHLAMMLLEIAHFGNNSPNWDDCPDVFPHVPRGPNSDSNSVFRTTSETVGCRSTDIPHIAIASRDQKLLPPLPTPI
jgi:hypothetical protein